MPILRPFSRLYPRMFPTGYSGSQVLRFALRDGPEQRLYHAGDGGLAGHKNLQSFINGFSMYSSQGSIYSSISGHYPSNLNASILGAYCQTTSPKRYIVGYENGVPQFIDGRPIYRCVDFLSAFLRVYKTSQEDLSAIVKGIVPAQADLGTYIIAGKEIFSGSKNLAGVVSGYETLPGSLSASIVGSYCKTLTPRTYFIGYENGVPQFIDGRPIYRCVDFLSASINQIYFKDLGATIIGKLLNFEDLGAYINATLTEQEYSLRASIIGWMREAQTNLTASIRGLYYKNITAFLRGLTYKELPAEIYGVPPKDLSAYLKVWPMDHLRGRVHGWQEADLGASIGWFDMSQLPASIGVHPPANLKARLKGWARGVTYDLGGWIRGFLYEGLGGIIRATYIEDLPAYIFSIAPKDLSAFIHGWQEADLPASLIGRYGPYDLHASIGVHRPSNLSASITVKGWTLDNYGNLTAYINPATILMQQASLAAIIAAHSPDNLGASLIVSGASVNLPAFIYPKMVYMTAALSVSTMEHANLGGVINFICRGSGYKELGATIDFSYLANLTAQITGKKYPSYSSNLGATVGYAANYIFMDRVPISLTVGTGYSIEDKIPLILSIYKQQAYLSATITGTYLYKDVGATITPVWLQEYEFDNVKVRELVYDINHARQVNWYEVVELYFKSIVDEYFYVGGEGKVYRTDRTDRWRLDVASFIPADIELNVRRKLHRVKTLYDLTKFNNMDEAIRFAIHYVTSYDYGDLSSVINATGGYVNLLCSITPKGFTTDDDGLAASISAQQKSFVLGFDDRVEFI